MQWTLIRTWEKDKGYKTTREKSGNESNPYNYYWEKIDDPAINGTTNSLSKLATAIYNHMTNNAFVEYQIEYALKKASKDIDHNAISGSW